MWDVDGTLAETERDGHRVAFNQAFAAFGLPWRWDCAHYGELLAVTGGRERLLHEMQQCALGPASVTARDALARELHASKNKFYADLVRTAGLALRPGVAALMRDCEERGVRMAITTTTSRANVDVLMRAHFGANWSHRFSAVVCGEDVQHKKPDPEVYCRVLSTLGLAPTDAVAIEDSPAGVMSARAAGIPVVVARSAYFADAAMEGALAIGQRLDDRRGWQPRVSTAANLAGRVTLDDIMAWHARAAG